MKLFPKSSEDWKKFFFFPFRAYVILAFLAGLLLEEYWQPRHDGVPAIMAVIVLGYIVSFVVFLIGWLTALDTKTARLHFIFMLITFFIGLYSLRYLASA
jgi:biotin transporter BioY